MRRPRRGRAASAAFAAAAVMVALWLLPVAAMACPACATRADAGGVAFGVVVSLFISFPFAVVAIALRVIRRTVQDEKNSTSSSRRASASA